MEAIGLKRFKLASWTNEKAMAGLKSEARESGLQTSDPTGSTLAEEGQRLLLNPCSSQLLQKSELKERDGQYVSTLSPVFFRSYAWDRSTPLQHEHLVLERQCRRQGAPGGASADDNVVVPVVAHRGEAARLLEGREIPQREWRLGRAPTCRYRCSILFVIARFVVGL